VAAIVALNHFGRGAVARADLGGDPANRVMLARRRDDAVVADCR
jgi:hypothetical protein